MSAPKCSNNGQGGCTASFWVQNSGWSNIGTYDHCQPGAPFNGVYGTCNCDPGYCWIVRRSGLMAECVKQDTACSNVLHYPAYKCLTNAFDLNSAKEHVALWSFDCFRADRVIEYILPLFWQKGLLRNCSAHGLYANATPYRI